jgi:hypothetical protein
MGNMMIQPMMYFHLENVPMFWGAYLITEVKHNIRPHHVTTTFRGTRVPRIIVPLVTDPYSTMVIGEIDPKKGNGKSASTLYGNSTDWKSSINTSSKKYNSIKSNWSESQLIQFLQNNVEGGYYHPVHELVNPKRFKGLYDGSGETMFGEDRAAGQTEQYTKGAEFWKLIDKYSGFGHYGVEPPTKPNVGNNSKTNYSRNHKTKGWESGPLNDCKNILDSGGGWKWNHKGSPVENELKKLSSEIGLERLDKYYKSKFKSKPEIINLLKSDARTNFLWLRASYNGINFFEKFANNMINVYNSGVKDIDKLIEADIDFRWRYAQGLDASSQQLIQQNLIKYAEYVGVKP